jgi:hypothetical protein
MSIWKNEDIRLPRGVAKAFAAAVTHEPMEEAARLREEIFSVVDSTGTGDARLYRESLRNAVGSLPIRLQDIAFVQMWNAKSSHKPATAGGQAVKSPTGEPELIQMPTATRQPDRKAAKPLAPARVEELLRGAKDYLKKSFGEDIVAIA